MSKINGNFGVIAIASACVTASVAMPAWAAEMEVGTFIPVVINVYKNAGITDEQITEAIKEANKILKQVDSKLVPVKTIKDSVAGDTDEDGKVDWGSKEFNKWTEEGEKEINKLANKKGVKISFAKEVKKDDPRTYGWAFHNRNTAAVVNRGNAVDTGATLAHEIGHIFMADDHIISAGPPQVKADGGHAPDVAGENGKENIMASAGFRTGTKFTATQKAEFSLKKDKFGKTSEKFKEVYEVPKKAELQFDARPDPRGDAFASAPGYNDFVNVIANSRLNNQYIDTLITLGDNFTGPVNTTYKIKLDTNVSRLGGPTGSPDIGGGLFNYCYDISISGDAGVYTATATLQNLITNTVISVPGPQILSSTIVDEGSDVVADSTTQLSFQIDKSLVGLGGGLSRATASPIVPISITSGTGFFADDTVDLAFDLLKWQGDPTLLLDGDGVPTPGASLPFSVSGLQPNDVFNLFLNDDIVYSGFLDSTGSAAGSFLFPTNVDVSTVNFLTAQDSTGEFAYSITGSVIPEPTSLLVPALAAALLPRRRR